MSQKRKLDRGKTVTIMLEPELQQHHHTQPGAGQTSMEFNDMCDDVIDKIMGTLQLKDLASISDTNARLRAIARSVFSRKHAHALISMDAFHYHIPYLCDQMLRLVEHGTRVYCKHDMMVRISDARIWFKLVRNFGGSIKHLRISSYHRYETRIPNVLAHLVENISEFCRDSLETFELSGQRSFTLNMPLKKLQNFCFCHGGLENMEVLKWMPNLRDLRLENFPKIMARNCEKLERLSLTLNDSDVVRTFISFIQQNEQIKYLNLNLGGGNKIAPEQRDFIYSSIADNLTQLTSLKLSGDSEPVAMTRYHFKTVESFTICDMDPDPQRVFEFDNLRKVSFKLCNAQLFYVTNFVQRNKKLKILKLGNGYGTETFLDDVLIRTLLNELPKLEEIVVGDLRCRFVSILRGLLGEEWEQFDKEKTGKFKAFWQPKYHRFRKIRSKTSA